MENPSVSDLNILAAHGQTARDSNHRFTRIKIRRGAQPFELSRRAYEARPRPFALPKRGSSGHCRIAAARRRIPSACRKSVGSELPLTATSSRRDGHQLQQNGRGSSSRYGLLSARRIQRAHIGHRLAPRLCRTKQLQPRLHAFDANSAYCLPAATKERQGAPR